MTGMRHIKSILRKQIAIGYASDVYIRTAIRRLKSHATLLITFANTLVKDLLCVTYAPRVISSHQTSEVIKSRFMV